MDIDFVRPAISYEFLIRNALNNLKLSNYVPTDNCMFNNNNKNTRTRCEVCSKLTKKTPERCSGVFIVNYEHISHFVLVFLLLTSNKKIPAEVLLLHND